MLERVLDEAEQVQSMMHGPRHAQHDARLAASPR